MREHDSKAIQMITNEYKSTWEKIILYYLVIHNRSLITKNNFENNITCLL
jgi:hypothetical protein